MLGWRIWESWVTEGQEGECSLMTALQHGDTFYYVIQKNPTVFCVSIKMAGFSHFLLRVHFINELGLVQPYSGVWTGHIVISKTKYMLTKGRKYNTYEMLNSTQTGLDLAPKTC